MKYLLLPLALLLGACGVKESEYNALEEKCRQLESQNRVLQRDLRDARQLNDGLNEEVDHFSRRMNDEATGNRDRLNNARVTLTELQKAVDDLVATPRSRACAERCDSLINALDRRLSDYSLQR